MLAQPHDPDRVLTEKVSQQLKRRGIRAPCSVRVSVQRGNVVLSGKIQFEVQRQTALHAASSVVGVRSVADQLQVSQSSMGTWRESGLRPLMR
jgi:osmotically-inducible protein OsmY